MESGMRGLVDGKCHGGWQMESDMRGLADGKCQGDWQMEGDMMGLAEGKCQEGVGRWKVSGAWQM